MKHFLLLFTFFCHLLGVAQEMTPVLSVRYKTYQRETEESSYPFTIVRQLDIFTDGKSAFYPYCEKVKLNLPGGGTYLLDDRELYAKRPPYCVMKNYPSEGMLTYTGSIDTFRYKYEEFMPVMDWEMIEADSVVCGYQVQKARTTFRGRTWVVWYAVDLPYSEGPWKLCGLPGVILKAYDTKGDFSFSAFKIGTNMTQPLDANPFRTNGYAKTTGRQFEKEQKEYYADKAKYVTGKSIVDDPVNGFYRPAPEHPCLMDDYEKE